jgi:uncharacterized membrane protein
MAVKDKVREREFWVLILCVLVAFALRFYTFDKKSFWLDEIYTIEDSKDDLKGQLKYYKDNPTYFQAPLFFVITHQLYPFPKPERDLRIIPLIFGTLSIPMIYFLAKQFSPSVALPCALSLAFMTYHISLSQDGRCYSLLMFLGMAALYFFMRHLKSLKKGYLLLMALSFSLLFYTSYSSIPFIALSQILWFYKPKEGATNPTFSSFLALNGLIFLFCLPWILFVTINYKGQPIMDPLHLESSGSFGHILYGVIHDWLPHAPLIILSVLLAIFFPILSKHRRNAFILLTAVLFPIVGVYLFCELSDFSHFVTSRYFINSMSLFLITLFLSLDVLEEILQRFRKLFRLRLLFIILLVASNLVFLPIYYRSEKQDFRGVVNYLRAHIRAGDKVIVSPRLYVRGLLYYFGIVPSENRDYLLSERKVSEDETEYSISLFYKGSRFTISHSETYWNRYIANGERVWLVVDKETARAINRFYPLTLKRYFDGSVLNLVRFPTDVSMYLFLSDPEAPGEKGDTVFRK